MWFPFSCASACAHVGVRLRVPHLSGVSTCSRYLSNALRDSAFPRGLHRLLPRGGRVGPAVWLRGSRLPVGVQQVWGSRCLLWGSGGSEPPPAHGLRSFVLVFSAEMSCGLFPAAAGAPGSPGISFEPVSVFPFAVCEVGSADDLCQSRSRSRTLRLSSRSFMALAHVFRSLPHFLGKWHVPRD